MVTGSGEISVQLFYYQIQGRCPNRGQIAVDPRRSAHFIRSAIEICQADVVRNRQSMPGQKPAYWRFVDQQRVGFVGGEPKIKCGLIISIYRYEWFAAVGLRQPALPIKKGAGPKIVRDLVVRSGTTNPGRR